MVIGEQGCPHIFGRYVLVGRVGFALRIYEINEVTKQKFVSHICVDDSSLILSFPLHIFLVNNFQCKIV
jgi:hypothetical protein